MARYDREPNPFTVIRHPTHVAHLRGSEGSLEPIGSTANPSERVFDSCDNASNDPVLRHVVVSTFSGSHGSAVSMGRCCRHVR